MKIRNILFALGLIYFFLSTPIQSKADTGGGTGGGMTIIPASDFSFISSYIDHLGYLNVSWFDNLGIINVIIEDETGSIIYSQLVDSSVTSNLAIYELKGLSGVYTVTVTNFQSQEVISSEYFTIN